MGSASLPMLATPWFFGEAVRDRKKYAIFREGALAFDFISDLLYFIEVKDKAGVWATLVGVVAALSWAVDCMQFGRVKSAHDAAHAAQQKRDRLERSGWASWWERKWGENVEDARTRRERDAQQVGQKNMAFIQKTEASREWIFSSRKC